MKEDPEDQVKNSSPLKHRRPVESGRPTKKDYIKNWREA
jgi:hypothetical protein